MGGDWISRKGFNFVLESPQEVETGVIGHEQHQGKGGQEYTTQ